MPNSVQNDAFPITRHSVILAIRDGNPTQKHRAMETISAAYWKPIYKYIRLKWELSREDAEDVTQEFLLRLIEKEFLGSFDPAKGRLRTFLRTCVDRLFLNHVRDSRREKRNAGNTVNMDFDEAEREFAKTHAASSLEEYFDKECARNLLALGVECLRAKCESSGRLIQFQLFSEYHLGEEPAPAPSYAHLAVQYGLAVTDVTNYLAWARREFRACVLDHLRAITASDEEFRREAKAVLGVRAK